MCLAKPSSNVAFIVHSFTKIKNELLGSMGELRSEHIDKLLEECSSQYKFAVLNEVGMKLIHWIDEFKEIGHSVGEDAQFDINDAVPRSDIHFATLTPFSNFKNQPKSIRDFLSCLRQEFDN